MKLATEKAAHAANTPEDLLREFEKTIERQAPSVREKIKATMESELDRAILANYRDIPTVVELYTTAKLSGAPPKPTHRTFALIIRACTLQIRPPEANPEEPAGAEVEAAGEEQVERSAPRARLDHLSEHCFAIAMGALRDMMEVYGLRLDHWVSNELIRLFGKARCMPHAARCMPPVVRRTSNVVRCACRLLHKGCALWHARRARGKLHAAHCKLVHVVCCMLSVAPCLLSCCMLHIVRCTLHWIEGEGVRRCVEGVPVHDEHSRADEPPESHHVRFDDRGALNARCTPHGVSYAVHHGGVFYAVRTSQWRVIRCAPWAQPHRIGLAGRGAATAIADTIGLCGTCYPPHSTACADGSAATDASASFTCLIKRFVCLFVCLFACLRVCLVRRHPATGGATSSSCSS